MDKDLFKTIDTIIRKERLYAKMNLMREDITKSFDIGRHHLNDQLNAFADGMSFPQYINSIRLEVAYDLLTNHLEMTIGDIAREVVSPLLICVNNSSAAMASPLPNTAPASPPPMTTNKYVRTTEFTRHALSDVLRCRSHIGSGIGTISVAATQQCHCARHHTTNGIAPMDGSLLHHGGTESRMVVCAGHLLADG